MMALQFRLNFLNWGSTWTSSVGAFLVILDVVVVGLFVTCLSCIGVVSQKESIVGLMVEHRSDTTFVIRGQDFGT